jgi:competence protein ComEA
VLERSSIGVLGTIVAGLALAALASIESDPAPTPAQAQPPRVAAPASAIAVRALRDGETLDLNQAGPADLELLPGIGPSLARRIVEDRERSGAFGSTQDLRRVRGIGDRTLARLRALLSVSPNSTRTAGASEPSSVRSRGSTPPRGSQSDKEARPATQ